MIAKIRKTIIKYSLLEKGDRVVAAVSGGADSCALLSALHCLGAEFGITVFPAHFNHGQRGADADADEAFCRQLAQKYGLSLEVGKIDVAAVPRGMSPEDYFRRERYAFLDLVASKHSANKIALGHHRGDQAETILINMLRGGGPAGLKGILPMRDGLYIRPLIEVSRREISAYLEKEGTGFREDASNASGIYLRNRVRQELIPFLKEKYNPSIEKNLSRMAEILRREDEWFDMYVGEIASSEHIERADGKISLSVEYFKTLHAAPAFRLVKMLLEGARPEGAGFSFSHIESVVRLISAGKTGKRISLPYGIAVRKDYDRVVITCREDEKHRDYEYGVTIPSAVIIKERQMTLRFSWQPAASVDYGVYGRVFFDEDKISGPLVLRNRRKGDSFAPLGMSGTQKVKKLFIDRKIPRRERDRIALLADGKSIIWIENLHLSERVKITPGTKNAVMLELLPSQTSAAGVSQENI